jgi:hypothetical protein
VTTGSQTTGVQTGYGAYIMRDRNRVMSQYFQSAVEVLAISVIPLTVLAAAVFGLELLLIR